MADTDTTLDPRQAEQHRLIEESAALDELDGVPGWEVFRRYAEEFLVAHQNVLAGGAIGEIGEYRFIAGRVQGIQQVLQIPQIVRQARDRALEPDQSYEDPLAGLDLPNGGD